MLTEQRLVVFPDAELIEAILRHARTTERQLPHGDVVGLHVRPDPEPSVSLSVRGGGGDETVRFDQSYLVGALLRYCIDHKIMVPKRARKWLEVSDGALALVLHMDGHGRRDPGSSYVAL